MWRQRYVGLLILGVCVFAALTWYANQRQTTSRSPQRFDTIYLGDAMEITNNSDFTLTEVTVRLRDQGLPLQAEAKAVPDRPSGDGGYHIVYVKLTPGEPLSLRPNESARFRLDRSQHHQQIIIAYREGDARREEVHTGVQAR